MVVDMVLTIVIRHHTIYKDRLQKSMTISDELLNRFKYFTIFFKTQMSIPM